jgi:hypothetical protein
MEINCARRTEAIVATQAPNALNSPSWSRIQGRLPNESSRRLRARRALASPETALHARPTETERRSVGAFHSFVTLQLGEKLAAAAGERQVREDAGWPRGLSLFNSNGFLFVD